MSGRLFSLEEIRAVREERDRLQHAANEAERERLLPEMHRYLVRLATQGLEVELDRVEPGACHDCRQEAVARFRYGQVDVCISHLIGRVKARAQAEAA